MTSITEIMLKLGLTEVGARQLFNSGFTFEKPEYWQDYKKREIFFKKPRYDIGNRVYIFITKFMIPQTKEDLLKIKSENIELFLRGKVVGYYGTGYFIKITDILKNDRGDIEERNFHAFHHVWVENAEFVRKRLKLKSRYSEWRIA